MSAGIFSFILPRFWKTPPKGLKGLRNHAWRMLYSMCAIRFCNVLGTSRGQDLSGPSLSRRLSTWLLESQAWCLGGSLHYVEVQCMHMYLSTTTVSARACSPERVRDLRRLEGSLYNCIVTTVLHSPQDPTRGAECMRLYSGRLTKNYYVLRIQRDVRGSHTNQSNMWGVYLQSNKAETTKIDSCLVSFKSRCSSKGSLRMLRQSTVRPVAFMTTLNLAK